MYISSNARSADGGNDSIFGFSVSSDKEIIYIYIYIYKPVTLGL